MENGLMNKEETMEGTTSKVPEFPRECLGYIAGLVRGLRIHAGFTWRAVAAYCYAELAERGYTADCLWYPPANQDAGRKLCDKAAEFLGEDPDGEGWN
jgi:hypothetical protein